MENGDLGIDAGMDLEAETVDVSATVIREADDFNDRDQRNGGRFGEKNGSYRSERDGRQRRFGNDSRRSDRRQAENGGRRRTSGEGSYRAAGSGFKGEKR